MLWVISGLFLSLWLIGYLLFPGLGLLVHLLLVFAVLALIIQLQSTRRAV